MRACSLHRLANEHVSFTNYRSTVYIALVLRINNRCILLLPAVFSHLPIRHGHPSVADRSRDESKETDGPRDDGVAPEERAEEEAGAVEEQHHAAASDQQFQHGCLIAAWQRPRGVAARDGMISFR